MKSGYVYVTCRGEDGTNWFCSERSEIAEQGKARGSHFIVLRRRQRLT